MADQYPWTSPYGYHYEYDGGGRGHKGQQSPPSLQPHLQPPSITPRFQDHHQYHDQQHRQNWEYLLGIAEGALTAAWQHLLSTGESVSAWQISEAALLSLQADSWSSLGLEMQQLPSLRAFIAIEARVHAFIHCFVTARGLTSLYDLETAICKNENIERFEELAMGPFLQHPLVKHYFSLNGEVSEVLKISTEEVVSHLGDYLYKLNGKQVVIEEFLCFLAKKKSVTAKEKLGVRIHSLMLHISFIQEARRSEHASLRISLEKKRQLAENSKSVEFHSGHYLSNSLGDDKLGWNFANSSEDVEEDDDLSKEVKRDELTNTKGKVKISHPDGTPIKLQVKKNAESLSFADWLKQDMKDRDAVLTDKASYTQKGKKIMSARLVMETSALRIFIKRWKEPCRNHSLAEVLEMMILEYQPKMSAKLVNQLIKQPVLALLNVALASIKCGMLDEIYDAIGKESLREIIRSGEDQSKHCGPIKSCVSANTKSLVECVRGASVEEIIDKFSEYLENHDKVVSTCRSILEERIIFLKVLYGCSSWVAEQFRVSEFEALGYGEFYEFLKVHVSLLPTKLQKILMGRTCPKSNFQVCMLPKQLEVLVSQALNSSWNGEKVTEKMISTLLANQFPFLGLQVRDGSLDDLLDNVGLSSNAISKGILFSQTLFMASCGALMPSDEDNLLETAPTRGNIEEKLLSASDLSKDAMEAVLRAPMLSDLNSWTHWDRRFAPLGPLLGWLLNDVNTNDLMCLMTRDGKVIRIDHSASLESFRQCALKGSPFQMAVQLLSLFASLGGEKHIPLSLLKRYAGRAFDVISKNHADSEAVKDAACKYFIECVSCLPTEFCAFAADVLLSGLKSVTRDVPSVILSKCKLTDERVMLHGVGLSLGIVEWIDDYHLFCSTCNSGQLKSFEPSIFNEVSTTCPNVQDEIEASVSQEQKDVVPVAGEIRSIQYGESVAIILDGEQGEMNRYKEACLVIESIRREEFGLDPGLSGNESSLLKKQHARLGRALHCLSQELYSQDSHFLLELVQNADDNNYPEDAEPTLTFILQEPGVIILNNEWGFSSHNIRALCDVGNSTKKGSNAGYIGNKGIGFKSVFRVTDAPEIHSNGFHLKFDINEGQIGFILPTPVPPFNIRALCKTASLDSQDTESDRWNTCIVLPFKSKLSEGSSRNNVINMFTDLHPSLLLFLHRLKCIKFRNMLDDSLTIMRKEVLSNGITKVSHGKEEMNWFVVTQKLQADILHRNVEATEIALAFTLEELEDGKYRPFLDQQPVFAFLPLRTYGLKFILQADFILPSSREEVDGDDPWNQWLLSEFPNLFTRAQRSFCSLPCFKGNLGEAITAYISYVPLIGEVHGFFSSLPRMILPKLRLSSCLLVEGDNNTWVPPCKVLRGWNEQARNLLPDKLLQELHGLGFLDKDISIRDPLARALGVEEYGPKLLLQVLAALCYKKDGLQSMGVAWLAAWLNAFYTITFHSTGADIDSIEALRKLPFIPLSNGTFGSVDEDRIWLESDALNLGINGEIGIGCFRILCSNLRTVDQAFMNEQDKDINTRMLLKLGVQKLSSHEIAKLHVLPAICDHRIASQDKALMSEFLCFLAVHFESPCPSCLGERENLISELRSKAYILTDSGYRRSAEVPIHFGKLYGSPVDVSKFFECIEMEWHEVDPIYSKHPATKSFLVGEKKWKKFFHDLGITEFVQVVQVEKRISNMISRNPTCGNDLLISGTVAKDWESPELEKLLSLLSAGGNRDYCKFVLEVLDKLWDDRFCDNAKAYCDGKLSSDGVSFSSSFVNNIRGVPWIMSSMDSELHYPKDLFYDCDAVHSVLGPDAPYAIPKVKSSNLLQIIGFKTTVTLEDVLEILRVWIKSETPVNRSIVQMSQLYTFLWKEMDDSSQIKMTSELLLGPFIFLPFSLGFGKKAVLEGSFWSPKDVCWIDTTGALDLIKKLKHQCGPKGVKDGLLCMPQLSDVYLGLHDFFVYQCGVPENPSFLDYFQILQHLSAVTPDPSEGAKSAFSILKKLADAIKSGEVSDEDIVRVKDNITEMEGRVFPTINKKWVSLHPSFGLVCWPDDEMLVKDFKLLHKIELLHFGELSDAEKNSFGSKMPGLMKTLGIPAFSEVLTRKAISYGLVDSSCEASLVDWSLPYAQRYIYHTHSDAYHLLKKSGFSHVCQLQVVVVKTLFYRNVVKNLGIESEKQFPISSLLQGNKLFVTQGCDPHKLFMELSRLFFNGIPELHLANFLLMIRNMIISDSMKLQVEDFIINSQKVPQLPPEETLWSLPPPPPLDEDGGSGVASYTAQKMKPGIPFKPKRKPARESSPNWLPSSWTHSGSGFMNPTSALLVDDPDPNNLIISRVSAAASQNWRPSSWRPSGSGFMSPTSALKLVDDPNKVIIEKASEVDIPWTLPFSNVKAEDISATQNTTLASEIPQSSSCSFEGRNTLNTGMPDEKAAVRIGRVGEVIAFQHLCEKYGKKSVTWVNEDSETGNPYDITVAAEGGTGLRYIEVKATRSVDKDWFSISNREWEFAARAGDSFSIAHVALIENNTRIRIFKDPVELCRLGNLRLAILMPKEQEFVM